MKSKYFGLLLCSLILGACNKVEVATPDFEVSTLTKSVKAGEELTFQFTGDPDQISFYSGEPLSDYTFKSGRTVSTEGLDLSFTTTVQYGAQKDQLSILYSTDFSGNYTLEDIRKATCSGPKSDMVFSSNDRIVQVLGTPSVDLGNPT